MKLINYFFAACCAALLSSCATFNTTPYRTSDDVVTNVTLSKANFKVIKQAIGNLDQCYVFGIGGFGERNAESNSRFEMFKDANLKDNQCVINIATTTSITQILFVTRIRAITTGTVIEFIPTEEEIRNAAAFKNSGSPTLSATESEAQTPNIVKVTPSAVGFPISQNDIKLRSKAVIDGKEYEVERFFRSGGITTIKLISGEGTTNEIRKTVKCVAKKGMLELRNIPEDFDANKIEWYFNQ